MQSMFIDLNPTTVGAHNSAEAPVHPLQFSFCQVSSIDMIFFVTHNKDIIDLLRTSFRELHSNKPIAVAELRYRPAATDCGHAA